MRIPGKLWKGVGLGGLVLLAALVVVRAWVVPTLIARRIEAQLGGRATFGSWWLKGSSAGVSGLVLRDGSEAWATADRVTTDLSLGGVLRGRLSPGRVTIDGVKLALRYDRDGRLLTHIGGSSPDGGGAGSTVVVRNAQITIHQEGRPEFLVTRVQARLAPYKGAAQLAARSDDPDWGPLEAYGDLDPSLRAGKITLASKRGIAIDPRKVERIPFVPPDVWTNILPHGAVGALVVTDFGRRDSTGVRVEIDLRGTTVRSSALDLTARGTTGRVLVDGGLVRLENVSGEAVDGRVEANGTLDFTRSPTRFDLGLGLKGIDVAKTPKSWQLDKAGVTGRLSGKVQLKAALDSRGVDLTGSTGEAEVTGGTIQGIPVKSLKLVMRAQGNNLQYESDRTSASMLEGISSQPSLLAVLCRKPAVKPGHEAGGGSDPPQSPLRKGGSVDHSPPYEGGAGGGLPLAAGFRQSTLAGEVTVSDLSAVRTGIPLLLVALQDPAELEKKEKSPLANVTLPKTITTHIELEDVEMAQLIAKAKFLFGMPLPIPVAGKLDLKATATIPLGELRTVKDYAFHGDLALRGASLFRLDVGTLSARIDLADGVLELKKLRGRLENRPNGGPDNPPEPLPPVPSEGPLPPGAFRMDLRAELSPPGRLTAQVDGDQLPLCELLAPVLPRPTPLSGLITTTATAVVDLGHVGDPKAWDVDGRVNSVQIAYRGTTLDSVTLAVRLKDGRLDVADVKAQMNGQPLAARLGLDLAPPHAFDGRLDVAGWDIASLVALVPSVPRPAPVAGVLTARADARGTLAPLNVDTRGQGRFDRFQTGPVPLGDVPFRWETQGDTIAVSVVEAQPFGGWLQAEARVPTTEGRSIEGSAAFQEVDTGRLSAALPGGGLKLTGKAAGRARFTIPADATRLESSVQLAAPDLTIQGIPAAQVQASVEARQGTLTYDVTAESLGGKVKFRGDFPLTAAPANAADAELRAASFTLKEVWKALGIGGAAARLEGLGAIDANVRVLRGGPDAGVWARGLAEVRDLGWGPAYPLGRLRGAVTLTPTSWRVEPVAGELLGGPAVGQLWGETPERGPRHMGFEFRIDRAPLPRVLAVVPLLKANSDGFGSLRAAGRLEDGFRATAELEVSQAQFFGLPVNELRAPIELMLAPDTGTGRLQLRRFSARLAGGTVRGDATLRIGEDESFQTDLVLANIDVELLARALSDSRRNESGRVSGRVSLTGPTPADVARYRGKVALTLSEASLFNVPVFREIDRFLGAARGGLFEAGGLTGTIANKQLVVEQLALAGRVVQLHATGDVGFDGQLSLDVLINTNQIIPETGQALVRLIPGLGDAMGRRKEATLRVANYLSNRLLKLHVGGTVHNPSVSVDPSVVVADTAVAFFAGVLKLPLGLVK